MVEYDNNMRGVLFKNKEKRSDKDPEYRGRIEVEGVENWLSAWINESQKDGIKYMSLRVNHKDQAKVKDNGKSAPAGEQAPFAEQMNDEIPF